jgi:hypothetical protein
LGNGRELSSCAFLRLITSNIKDTSHQIADYSTIVQYNGKFGKPNHDYEKYGDCFRISLSYRAMVFGTDKRQNG